ncbi:hypothetical protein GGI12_004603 [Dipsacomyces acuminosporus]|nr:hypothetical protein GGI12_004603 [Dipsacomyces acuminosporus]
MESEMDLIRQRNAHDVVHGPIHSSVAAMMQKTSSAGHGPFNAFGGNAGELDPSIVHSSTSTTDQGCSISTCSSSSIMASLSQSGSLTPQQQQPPPPPQPQQQQQQQQPTTMTFQTGASPIDTVRNLIGSSISTGAKLNNLDGTLGIFFVFPDLSIRKDGEYRLRFSFFDLKSETGDLITTSSPIRARIFSDPFKVYSAKQFPGMIESTTLSKHFAKQGVKIPVRKESNKSSHDDDLE